MNLADPRFQDVEKARAWLEALRWPHGALCPHCGNSEQTKIKALHGSAHRPGLYQCAECRKQFTVTVGTVMESSKIPLNKWVLAMHLVPACKKDMSVRQLQRLLGVSYQSAWSLRNRVREANANQKGPPGLAGDEGRRTLPGNVTDELMSLVKTA